MPRPINRLIAFVNLVNEARAINERNRRGKKLLPLAPQDEQRLHDCLAGAWALLDLSGGGHPDDLISLNDPAGYAELRHITKERDYAF